jgi:hypothetical protein
MPTNTSSETIDWGDYIFTAPIYTTTTDWNITYTTSPCTSTPEFQSLDDMIWGIAKPTKRRTKLGNILN